MTNSLKPLDFGKGLTSVEEALAELEGYTPRREPEPDSNPDIEPSGDPDESVEEADIIPQDYILLEAGTNYLDTLISTTRTLKGNNWFDTHTELHRQGLYMPSIRQFVDFLKLLRSGRAFNGDGDIIPSSQLDAIYKDITEVRDPWRAEWLDADFKVINDVLHMNYNHRMINGDLQPRYSEPLQPYLTQDKTPGIDLEYWLNNATSKQGLPPSNNPDGKLYYWSPMSDNKSVAWFFAGSGGAFLFCDRNPGDSYASLGVRPCARKN